MVWWMVHGHATASVEKSSRWRNGCRMQLLESLQFLKLFVHCFPFILLFLYLVFFLSSSSIASVLMLINNFTMMYFSHYFYGHAKARTHVTFPPPDNNTSTISIKILINFLFMIMNSSWPFIVVQFSVCAWITPTQHPFDVLKAANARQSSLRKLTRIV